jgi:hypothetical protein
MTTTVKATEIVRGDEVTDIYGRTYTVTRVEHNVARGAGVYLHLETQGYPEFFLNGAEFKLTTTPRPVPTAQLDSLTRQYIAESQARLNRLTATPTLDDGKWRYLAFRDLNGHMDRREYRTEKGFLTAYIRVARQGCDILIAE